MVNTVHKPYELNIELSTPEILMMGSSSESAGKLLQGTVILNLAESMKIRLIKLSFLGTIRTGWYEGSGHHQCHRSEEKELIKHKWQLLPILNQKNKKSFLLGPGEHKWNFELVLPGDLPQSVETESGEVLYLLKATVERPAFSQNVIKRLPVQIVRCVLPSEFELNQSMVVCSTWPRKMSYDITLPSKVFPRGHLLSTTFNIRPIASKLVIRSITCILKEYCTYTAQGFTKTDSRVVKRKCKDFPFPRTAPRDLWSTVVTLDIPPMASKSAFCDESCQLIKIRHKMKISISIINNDGHLSELRCSAPVIIMTGHPEQLNQALLPAYDQVCHSASYLEDPSSPDDSIFNDQLTTPSHQPYQLEASSTEIGNNSESVWWHGVNICRVPSYRTASRLSQHITLSSSLPSYDQLTSML